MTISTLIGSRLLSGIAAFALTGSLVGGTAVAAQPDHEVRELRHEVRDQSKAQREEIKQLRGEFAAEYAKENPDADKLERLHAAIEAKRDEINAMRFSALMKMHDELDAEQRERMAERLAGHGKGKGHDKAKGKGHVKGKGFGHSEDGSADADASGKGKGKRGQEAKANSERGKAKAEDAKAERGKDKDKAKDKGKNKAERREGKRESAPV